MSVADPTGAHPSRPALVLSDADRPYIELRHTIVLCSSTKHAASLVIPFDQVREGRLRTTTYAGPWALYSVDNEIIQQRIGRVSDGFMVDLGEAIRAMVVGTGTPSR